MWGGYEHAWGWGMGFGMIGVVLFWVFVVLGAVILVKWIAPSFGTGRQAADKTALDILKERYARSEIGREEFEQKRRDISS